jgi:hypothetical protein
MIRAGRRRSGALQSIHAILWLAVLLLAGDPVRAAEGSPAKSDAGPRAEMHRVFEAVAHLLPLGLDEKAWADPANRASIQKWLDQLATRTLALERHAERRDIGFRNLSRSLSADVQETRDRFRSGRYDESRFFMLTLTGNCVACHARLSSARDFPMAERLTAEIDFESLSAHEQTQILIATRRFSDALDVWETTFAGSELTPGQLDLGGYLLDYLTVAVRVMDDPKRARATLVKLDKRPDMPRYLHRHLVSWIAALDVVDGMKETDDPLGMSRRLVLDGAGQTGIPMGREETLYDLVASGLLLQFIDANEASQVEIAEAFYLLGLVESRTIDSYWVPQAEFHLEAAIRLAPDAPFAVQAYAILEEYVIVGYGGASGNDLPADVWAKLNELRTLIDEQG